MLELQVERRKENRRLVMCEVFVARIFTFYVLDRRRDDSELVPYRTLESEAWDKSRSTTQVTRLRNCTTKYIHPTSESACDATTFSPDERRVKADNSLGSFIVIRT